MNTDPNRPSYALDVRVTRVGSGYAAYAAHLPSAHASADTEREAVGHICRIVSGAIKACRKLKSSIPWHMPSPLREGEKSLKVALNMPTRQEELYRDKPLMALLQAWAKRPSHKSSLKQQRRVAARLHAMDYKNEAGSVLRQSWRAWEDPAMLSHYMANEVAADKRLMGFNFKLSSRLRDEFARFDGDHPVALMRAWWIRLNERTNAEWQYDHPSLLDEDERAIYEAKHRKDLRECMHIYHGKREDVEQAVETLLAHDQQQAEKHAEDMKEKVDEAYKRERDGALLREVAEQLELKEVIQKNEEKRREQG